MWVRSPGWIAALVGLGWEYSALEYSEYVTTLSVTLNDYYISEEISAFAFAQ